MRLSTPALASHAVPGVISGVIQYSRKSRWRLRWRLRKLLENPGKNGMPALLNPFSED
jgi:hypothetical protein